MFGWFTILKTVFGIGSKILGKFQSQKRIKVVNEIRLESYNLHKKKLENKAQEKINEEIDDFKSYLNRS